MSGIVGYTGCQPAVPIIVDGLRRLQKRGYDGAGMVLLNNGNIDVLEGQGPATALAASLPGENGALVGIGHTYWTSNGRTKGAHTDCTGQIGVVYNGMLENYAALKAELVPAGHTFRGDDDPELIAHLIEGFYQGDLAQAVVQGLKRLQGPLAIVVFHRARPEELVVACREIPLVIGLGRGENYIASDIAAILPHTKEFYLLEDGEVGIVDPSTVKILDRQGRLLPREPQRIPWDSDLAEKDGYEDFMLKEIHEQPRAIRDTLQGRIRGDEIILEDVALSLEQIQGIDKIVVVACGTAAHAGLVGKGAIEKLAGVPVQVEIASEFRYGDPFVDERTLTIVISQSGETADTLGALRKAKSLGSRILAVTNVVGSSVAREADDVIYNRAGPEIAIASTKAYVCQLVCLYLFALYLGGSRGVLSGEERAQIIAALRQLPSQLEGALATEGQIKELAQAIKGHGHVFFTGRGLDWSVAQEASLKLKETSYIHATAYATGEIKHGPMALVTEGLPIIGLVTQRTVAERMLANLGEVKDRGAMVVGIARDDIDLAGVVDEAIYLPSTLDLVMPVLVVVPTQLLAYYVAKYKGCDVDKPRNLTKSVTVE
ncbi:MAG: glutamine--fructose-6-phosphate transaminase (isomerizing) [Limnochordia bacterium]|jgi:glucosamine--fructose-6-phosphate aminotransferase (isomerizing)